MAISPEVLFKCLSEDLSTTFGPSFLKDCEGPVWPDITPLQYAGYSIFNSFLRKVETGRNRITDKRAEEKFLQCNTLCKTWELPINPLGPERGPWVDSRTETLLGEVRRAAYQFWFKDGEPLDTHPFELLTRGSVGPGVSVGSEGNSFYAKLFSSRLTCSRPSLYSWYSRYISSFPEWKNAENIRISNYGEASIASSNRLSFVPKNDEISRTICIEPTLDTIYQSGFGRIIESRLEERYGISLSSQQLRNRDLARRGSVSDDIVTIDLSSASDTISLRMLEWLLPTSFYKELCKYRSTHSEIKGRGTEELFMVSTMGNGFTFPLQTMIFSCAVIAAFRLRGLARPESSTAYSWGVNGDDICCPKIISKDVITLLSLLGFTVNGDKTFVEGPFRESCGGDYFSGRNIRGVYVKTLKTPGSRYAVLNLLSRFSTRTGLLLPRTWNRLYSTVKYLPVPVWENMDSGIQVPLSLVRGSGLFNASTQCYHYVACITITPKIRFREMELVVPRPNKPLIYNPSGLLISFLQRGITSGTIGVREGACKTIRKQRITSSWDNYAREGFDSFPWQWWDSTVSHYLEREV